MISVLVNDATEDYPIKEIIFRNSLDFDFKTTYFDKENQFICEELIEIEKVQQLIILTTYLLVGQNYDLIAYEKQTIDHINPSVKITTTINFKWGDGEFKKIASSRTEKDINRSEAYYYDMYDQLLYYEFGDYTKRPVIIKTYSRNNQEIFSRPDFCFNYKDVYDTTFDIRHDLLNTVIEKYRD